MVKHNKNSKFIAYLPQALTLLLKRPDPHKINRNHENSLSCVNLARSPPRTNSKFYWEECDDSTVICTFLCTFFLLNQLKLGRKYVKN